MGMFDYINYAGNEYQTKDTPEQGMELYEIRGNELWYKEVKREWVEDSKHFLGGYLQEISHEWKFCDKFDGLIRIYRDVGKDEQNHYIWEEYKILFMDGKIIKIEKVEDA
jgi:hypothetical protein